MILYIQDPKNSTKKLFHLINTFSKVAGYKIHTKISVTFLFTNNEPCEEEIKEPIQFTIA
jgi:hypothetical protein